MGLWTVTCQLGPTRATLVTNSRAVVDYLRNFYLVIDGAAGAAWVVEATVGPTDHSMPSRACCATGCGISPTTT